MPDLLYGRQPILEALKAGRREFQKLWIQDGATGDTLPEIIRLAREKNIPVEWSKRDQMDLRVNGNHQGVVAIATEVSYQRLEDLISDLVPTDVSVVLLLDEIQDPQNVGAILRSAGFFGVKGVVMPKWRTAPVSPAAARVSSGGVDRVPVIRVTNLNQAIHDLKEAGFDVVGADMEGTPLDSYPAGHRTAIVMGSEGSGLRRLVRERCDKLLKISGSGELDSLNVGAAAAIFLNKFCNPGKGARSQHRSL